MIEHRVPTYRPTLTFALLACAFGIGIERSPAHADNVPPERVSTSENRLHWSASIGWFGAISGPLAHGPSADVEIFPGGRFDSFGVGMYYRGDEFIGNTGIFALGLCYEAGASRPRLVMSLHTVIGYDTTNEHPVFGAGLRTQLGVSGPFIVASNMSGYLFLDGTDTRLGIALMLSMGLSD